MEEKKSENNNQNEVQNKNKSPNKINEIDNETKGNSIDIDKIWDNNSKYKINYTKVFEFLKNRNKNKYLIENEYWCNILLMQSEIELSNKISILNLLCEYYQKNDKTELIYNLSNKIEKHKDSFNAIDPALGINVYLKTINLLNNENTFMYSYRYSFKINDLIKKDLVSVKKKYNVDELNEFLNDKIHTDFINHLLKYKVKYMDENHFKIEDIQKIKNVIDLLISNQYNLNDSSDIPENENKENNIIINNPYLYAINKQWIFKAKIFIETYIKIKEQKINEFYEESFEPDYVYNYYFNEKTDNNKKNEKNKKVSKGFCAYPGPVNNFEITLFKDYWINFKSLDENDFIKEDMKLNENYLLVNEKDWKLFKSFFGATNEIKRKKDNLDLVKLKFILFDKRIDIINANVTLLKQKYIQINKNYTFKHLKEKIVNIINENLKYVEDKNINNKDISFYILDKNKKKILMEICFSFVTNIHIYDSIYLTKIDFKDENTLKDFFKKYNNKKHILVIEIFNSNIPNFLVDLKFKNNNNQFKCSKCKKTIENLKDKFNCEVCNFSLFCSEKCANESKDHDTLHRQYLQIIEEKFILSDLLSMKLEDILSDGTSYGRVGLYNMGNTCYLNSALQCLSNTEDLTKYFLNNNFRTEINNGNSLGSKGYISNEYSKLIHRMWNGNEDQFCPKEFRIKFCKRTQLFLNSEQQDSQEFLLAVLDNLHEDLNRITNKKYMELQEKKEGETDEQASKRWWDYFKSRENSIIMDLFQGQYKSTIKCSSCGNTSISYDTYINLGLPIPTKGTQTQIKFLTANRNFIDINIKIDEKIELKDIIKKAMEFINKNNYIKYLNNNENNLKDNDKLKNNINENIEKIIYNNIEVIEFNKGFKMNNIYKTDYENINKNYKSKNNMNQPLFDNIKLKTLFNNNNNNEIILIEKNINLDPQNNCNIYIYPMMEKEINGIFFSSIKKIILSYPIIITLNYKDSLEQLETLISQKLDNLLRRTKIAKEKSNLIEICFPHFTKGWGKFKIQNGECPICNKKYDKSNKKFCNIFNYLKKNTTISELINIQNRGKFLILYAKSDLYSLNKEIYSGMPLFDENSKKKYTKINFNIYDSFDLFNKEEILDGDNMWFCNKCKTLRKAGKKIQIYRTPIYLIIHLKRFKHRNAFAKALLGNKNDAFIEYKEILNLKDFVVGPDKDKPIYSLYGVIIHKKFMNGGHYYAYCKNRGMWITFNDERISICHNPIDKDAYLLFYKRKIIE